MRLSIINFLILVLFISSCAPKPGTPESKAYLQKEKAKARKKHKYKPNKEEGTRKKSEKTINKR